MVAVEEELNELQATIPIVEQNRSKFKQITNEEIKARKNFIAENKNKLQTLKTELGNYNTRVNVRIQNEQKQQLFSHDKPSNTHSTHKTSNPSHSKVETAIVEENEEFIRQQQLKQKNILDEQDKLSDQLKKRCTYPERCCCYNESKNRPRQRAH